jgi:hypothetical protein
MDRLAAVDISTSVIPEPGLGVLVTMFLVSRPGGCFQEKVGISGAYRAIQRNVRCLLRCQRLRRATALPRPVSVKPTRPPEDGQDNQSTRRYDPVLRCANRRSRASE